MLKVKYLYKMRYKTIKINKRIINNYKLEEIVNYVKNKAKMRIDR